MIKTTHGILPVPAPATLNIVEKSNLIMYGGPIESELVTPTGAALLVNLNLEILPYPNEMNLIKIAYGTGQKKFKNFLNILRVFYGESKELEITDGIHSIKKYIEPITILETDIEKN